MQFTPQQMTGGPKFSSSTRIGNWFEEIAVEESKLTEFQTKSAKGQLYLRKQQAKIEKCNQSVAHSYSEDGCLRFGDIVMLKHLESHGTLAIDPYEDIFPNWHKFLVTLSPNDSPKARNTFQITRPPTKLKNFEDDENDQILHYGQPFLLKCHSTLLVSADNRSLAPALYLGSSLKNERTVTRISNQQSIFMTSVVDGDAVWLAVKPSRGKYGGSERYLTAGLPIYTGDELVITHRATNTLLCSDTSRKDLTDFGYEHECFTKRDNNNGVVSLMELEFTGRATPSTVAKADKPSNFWTFETSPNPQDVEIELPRYPTYEEVVDEIFYTLKSAGISGFLELRKHYADIDNDVRNGSGDGKLDKVDILSVLSTRGINMQPTFTDPLVGALDPRKTGLIDYRELLRVIRGSISRQRQSVIEGVFKSLTDENIILFDTLRNLLNFSQYPDVESGFITERQFKNDYVLKPLETVKIKKQNYVKIESFVDFFGDISAAVDDDRTFENLMWSFVSGNQ